MLSLTRFADDYLNDVETLAEDESINDDEDVSVNEDENNDDDENDYMHLNKKKNNQDEASDNTALMNHQQFDSFVKSTVISFLTRYNLGKITVDVGNGYKGSAKVNKNGEIETEVTFKEIL